MRDRYKLPIIYFKPGPSRFPEMCDINNIPTTPHQPKIVLQEEEDDRVSLAIKKTGCAELNDELAMCYFDKKDWRQCKTEMVAFKSCMDNYYQSEKRKQDIKNSKTTS